MNNDKLSTVKNREVFFLELYKKVFPSVARYVAKMGGSVDEAQDIFQDTLVIYYEKVTSLKKETLINEKAYLVGIAKNLWLQHHKTWHRNLPINDFDASANSDDNIESGKLLCYLETAGKKCMEMLKAYYYDHLTVGSIAEQFGYSGIHSATVAKYKCLEKIRETVKQKSLEYADFTE